MAFLATFLILVAFWIFMSDLLDVWHFGLGLLSCALVAYMSSDLLFKEFRTAKKLRDAAGFIAYLPWLFGQIFLANIHVVRMALSPNLSEKIFPHIVKFRTRLESEIAITAFANSITLTPGTVTVHVEGRYFYVHALDRSVAEALPGEMEDRVAKMYGEV